MNLKRTFAFVAMCYCAFALSAQNLTSPDGNLKMNFSLNSNGAPVYELFFKDKAVIKPSTLGLELKREDPEKRIGFEWTERKDKERVDEKMNLRTGFKIKDTTLKGFTIAGPDRVFYSAEAMVQNGKIIVSSPKVSVPLAARYGWADNPDCNLYGENGLPVAPFRTDCW